MTVSISGMRMSFIWMQPREDRFGEPAVLEPFAFLAREKQYVQRFGEVNTRYDGDPDGLAPPWPKDRDKTFWSLYLGTSPHDVMPADAWRHFVPLRWRIPPLVKSKLAQSRLTMESFFYPNGHALLVSLSVRPPIGSAWSTEQAADIAHAARFGNEYELEQPEGQAATLKLDMVARHMFASMRRKAEGQEGPDVPLLPYSVTTFSRVEDADAGQAIPRNGEIHRMLEAVVGWNKQWKVAPLSAWKDATVPDNDLPPGHAIYHGKKGRAIWFPALARTNATDQCIGCYHRNQTFAALQVEAIGALVMRTADSIRRGAQIPFVQEQCARIAAGVLGRLYGGSLKTYRSLACAYHMHDREIINDLAFLRDEYRMDPIRLVVPPPPAALNG